MNTKQNNKKNNNYLKAVLITVAKIVAVAIAYFIAGRLALFLAIPPGYASPIWPAAGIGLAGVLLFGYRVCGGVFLGSVFVNLWTSYDPSSIETFYISLGMAGSIGFGAGLQAFLGAYLIKRFGCFPNALERYKEILYFLLLGAPVSCLVNATVGISTLVISGAIELENFWISWFNWWVGDAIGVMVFTPIILILYLNDALIWKRRKVTIVIPLCLLFAMVVLFFIKARSWEQQKINYEFSRTLKGISSSLEKKINRYMEILQFTKGLYDSSDKVSKSGFSKFFNKILLQSDGIHAIAWIPVVKNSDLSDFKNEFENFTIKEKDVDGLIVNSKIRKEYVVVAFIEPFERNKMALGYDIASDVICLQALTLARDSGQPIATYKTSIVNDVNKLNGLLVFLPVYINGKPHDTLKEKQDNIVGYIAGEFKVDQIVKSAIKEVDNIGLDICIVDHHAPVGMQLIYGGDGGVTGKHALEFLEEWHKENGVVPGQTFPLLFANQKWELHMHYTQDAVLEKQTWHVWFVLVIGILFTGILGGFLLIITGRTSIIESSIALKEKAEKELEKVQKSLIHSEKLSAIGKLSASVAHEFNNPICGIRNVLETVRSDLIGEDKDEVYKKFVNLAIAECDRMAELIRKLQDFHKPSVMQPTLSNINAVVADTILFCEKRLKERGVELKTTYGDNIPDVEIVSDQIKQVLLNMIHNADDAIVGKSGMITILTQYLEPNVLIRIQDSGVGISEEDMSNIFEPFFTTKPEVKGIGLGLSICYGIIKTHGGDIKVESSPDNGAAFTIILPAVMA